MVTTLLDPTQASREELAELYRVRWNNEVDLKLIDLPPGKSTIAYENSDTMRLL